ncbi:hypothetical protein RZS08_45340, partial [Arthrospira platensis SPKY1]|nr:hypothetical protein [Arthrospira platensis SPKY1]
LPHIHLVDVGGFGPVRGGSRRQHFWLVGHSPIRGFLAGKQYVSEQAKQDKSELEHGTVVFSLKWIKKRLYSIIAIGKNSQTREI